MQAADIRTPEQSSPDEDSWRTHGCLAMQSCGSFLQLSAKGAQGARFGA